MDFTEFREYFWRYMNSNIITYVDINVSNKDFCDEFCYGFYRVYEKSNIDINLICKLAENSLFAISRFSPKF